MPPRDNPLKKYGDDIRQILQNSGTAQCSIHVERVGNSGKSGKHWSFFDSDEGGSSNEAETEDTIVYGIGSHTKLLIALLLSIIVDKLSCSKGPEHQKYRTLRDNWHNPWDARFTDIFNYFSDTKISTLPRNPTLRHVALHFNSLPPMNHVLLAIDGTPIMSKQSFLRVAPRLAQIVYEDSKEDYIEYSNGNYILIGYLVEAIAKDSLAMLMKMHLFEPLGMTNTFMEAPDPSATRIAHASFVSASGVRSFVGPWLYPTGSVVNSALGAHSCTRDFAILLRTIQACINGDESFFKNDFVKHLLKPDGRLNGTTGDALSLFGVYTTLDTSTPGSKSFNRLITPENICSTYRLGCKDSKTKVPAYYLAGAVKGYTSSSYFIPKWKVFIIVLTNTSGVTDASDHISRLLLQKTFDLSLTTRDQVLLVVKKLHKASGICASDLTNKVVDVVKMSSRAAVEGQILLQRLASEDAEKDTPNLRRIHLEGEYYNEKSEQSIVIKGNQAQIVGTASKPQPLGFIRTGNWTIRLRPLSAAGFTIDRYDPCGWKELSLILSTGGDSNNSDRVMCLSRQGLLFLDEFKRTETDSEVP
jgi:CubicO group peptidase (beta-lactamase class C family)